MAKKETLEIESLPLDTAEITFNVVGETPLIPYRFASKAWKELLLPSRRKNAAEKVMTLKHYPLKEYRECFYVNRDKSARLLRGRRGKVWLGAAWHGLAGVVRWVTAGAAFLS